MKQRRTVFFVSDQTGVTAETMGHSLLTQFDGMESRPVTLPFITTVDKAREAVAKIDQAGREEGARPIVFATLVDSDVRDALKQAHCLFLDFFDAFLGPLELELGQHRHTCSAARTGWRTSTPTRCASMRRTSHLQTMTVPRRATTTARM
jgi:hypothetical protein